jgi:PKD repeat protein
MLKIKFNRISNKLEFLYILFITFLLIFIPITNANLNYNLTVNTNQSQYYNTELVTITGRLTLDGTGFQAGVCVDITNPSGSNVLSVCFPTDSQGYYSVFYPLTTDSQIGIYNVLAKYEEGAVIIVSKSTTFEVVSSTIIPDAGDDYYGNVGQPISFSGDVNGGKRPYSWFWDFGDENDGDSQYPDHIYDSNGIYTISLLVIDGGGNSGEDTTTAYINDELIANTNGPYGGIIDAPVNFYGSAIGGFPPYEWEWDFGDGNNSNQQNPSHIYENSGEYEITLTVEDQRGFQAVDTTMITILLENNPPEKPTITGPSEGRAGTEYEFTFQSNDPDGDDVYYWILWFEGCPGVSWDGPYTSNQVITKSYTYTEQGSFNLQVKAKDIYNVESEWATLEISMPHNRIKNSYLIDLMNNYPLLFKLIERIFDIF